MSMRGYGAVLAERMADDEADERDQHAAMHPSHVCDGCGGLLKCEDPFRAYTDFEQLVPIGDEALLCPTCIPIVMGQVLEDLSWDLGGRVPEAGR